MFSLTGLAPSTLKEKRVQIILVITFIAAILIVSMPALTGPQAFAYCGDGICNEPILDCPRDCANLEGVPKELTLLISGEVPSIIKVSVIRNNGSILASESGRMNKVIVAGIRETRVFAAIRNPLNGKSLQSEAINLYELSVTFEITLPPDFFDNGAADYSKPTALSDLIDNNSSIGVYDDSGELLGAISMAGASILHNITNGLDYYAIITLPNGSSFVTDLINGPVTPATPAYPLITSVNSPVEIPPPPSSGSCIGTKGDFNGDGAVDEADFDLFAPIQAHMQEYGFSSEMQSSFACADINSDGVITSHDLDCLAHVLDGTLPSLEHCPICRPSSNLEICHDGVDNNCDGQSDRETYNNALSTPYPGDLCACISQTPCEMLYDLDGIEGRIIEGNKSCRSISALNGGAYTWYSLSECLCNKTQDGWTMYCAGRQYTCSGVYGWWAWRGADGIFGNETWGFKRSDNIGCVPGVDLINCPHGTSCEWSSPGYFDEVRSGGAWGGCALGTDYCECRCNRDKLICADYIDDIDPQSCWVPLGDYLCS